MLTQIFIQALTSIHVHKELMYKGAAEATLMASSFDDISDWEVIYKIRFLSTIATRTRIRTVDKGDSRHRYH